jgi:galactose mutarotase-like enzyme
MLYEISNGDQQIQISSLGSQLVSWKINNKDIFAKSDNYKRSGMPLMFPFCGPLVGNIFAKSGKVIGQHGFGRNLEWKLLKQSLNSISFVLSSSDLDTETKLSFPFEFESIFEVTLLDKSIELELKTKNLGTEKLPLAPGFHPYFAIDRSQKDKITITTSDPKFEFESSILPWSTGVEAQFRANPINYKVQIPNQIQLNFEDLSTLEQKSGNRIKLPCDLLTIWAGEVGDWVCIEPMAKRFDSINNDPINVEPKGVYSLKYKISF